MLRVLGSDSCYALPVERCSRLSLHPKHLLDMDAYSVQRLCHLTWQCVDSVSTNSAMSSFQRSGRCLQVQGRERERREKARERKRAKQRGSVADRFEPEQRQERRDDTCREFVERPWLKGLALGLSL